MTTMDLSATFLSFKKPGSIDGLLHEEESHREIMEDIYQEAALTKRLL